MRIGIYDPYLDDLGGGEKYMISLAECLSFRNKVTVFWDAEEDLRKVSKRFSLDISRIIVEPNIFSLKVPFLKRLFETLKYDAIVILSDGSIPFVFSKKLFVHFQQPIPQAKLSFKDNFKKKKVTSFFCNSSFTKYYIDKEFRVDSKVLYPPVDIKYQQCKKENIILHVGRFRAISLGGEDYKKQGIMLNTFKKMVDKGLKNWKFVLATGLRKEDEVKFNKLKKEFDGYPIDFLTNLNKRELDKVYSRAKIYWHASGYGEDLLKNPQMAEHFGISTVEAMSAGVVPVVINAGGQKEIVQEDKNGYLWETLEDLMEKTKKLIENEKLLKKLSDDAIKRAKVFNKERFCEDVKKIIER